MAFPLWLALIAPLTAGVFHLANSVVKREDVGIADIFAGARSFLAASWKLAAAQLLVTIILAADVAFFFGLALATKSFLYVILAALSLYALIFWGMMSLYQWPTLIEQRPTTVKTIYRSFLLTADNLLFTSYLFFVIILLSILCLAGMALLYMGAVAVMAASALRELHRKYGLAEIEPEVVEDTGWRLGGHR